MTRRIAAWTLTAALVTTASLVGAPRQSAAPLQNASAERRLEAAIHREQVLGDVMGAMEQYKALAKDANRNVAAQALVRLGACYEKLGEAQIKEARAAYERVLREFGDQGEVVQRARARLAALARNAEPQKPTFRKIRIPSKRSNYGKLSPDGQTLAYVEGRSLWTVPVHGKSDPNIAGAPTRLTEPMLAWDTANICVEWSADGKWIGFLVEVPQPDKSSVEELYVIPAAGGTPKRVHVRSETWVGQAYTLRYALSAGAEVLYFAAGKELDDLRIYSMPTSGGAPRPVTASATREPALSPNGSKIAYVKGGWRFGTGTVFAQSAAQLLPREVWVASVDGTEARLVYRVPDEAPGTLVGGPTWSPDGRMLAFLVCAKTYVYTQVFVLRLDDRGAVSEPARFDLPSWTTSLLAGWTMDNRIGVNVPTEVRNAIYTVPAAGGKALQLTPKGGSGLAWTADSKRIYFWGGHAGDRWGFEVIPADGGTVERLPLDREYERFGPSPGELSITPDGQLICLAGWARGVIEPGIFTLSIRGGRPTRLTTGNDVEAKCSPDGERIAFVRSDVKNENSNIFVVPLDGGEPRQVTTAADRVAMNSLAWSPDGRAIAFLASDKTLRIVPAAGGASRILAEVAGSGLTWSPDGETLAYVSANALWRIPAAGGAPTKIETGLDARLDRPVWSPDGRTIAFSASSGGEHEFWLMEDFLRLVKTVR